jgi:hypothetical protein
MTARHPVTPSPPHPFPCSPPHHWAAAIFRKSAKFFASCPFLIQAFSSIKRLLDGSRWTVPGWLAHWGVRRGRNHQGRDRSREGRPSFATIAAAGPSCRSRVTHELMIDDLIAAASPPPPFTPSPLHPFTPSLPHPVTPSPPGAILTRRNELQSGSCPCLRGPPSASQARTGRPSPGPPGSVGSRSAMYWST